MKNLYITFLIITSVYLNGQIGINTKTPDESAILDIYANNKGVSFPKFYLQNKTDVSSIPIPKESLLIYNTNDIILGKKGYYFWDGAKWDYFFNDLNQTNLLNHVKYYSSTSSIAYNFTRAAGQFLGYSAHVLGETLNTAQWTVITGLTANIVVDRPQNNVLMNANGMFQANNSSANNTSGIRTSIGFFIDDKLVDVKPMFLDFQSPCSYRQFMIYGNTKNLSTGNHTIKFAIRNIESPVITGLSVTYGQPNSSCSPVTLSNFESSISGTIFISQPYAF
jgi:hypothetical protein